MGGYLLEREDVLPCEDGAHCRVFFGALMHEVAMQQNEAAANLRYAPFFNVNGHFTPLCLLWLGSA